MNIYLTLKDWYLQVNQKWLPASVPGCVHTDLYNHKIIQNPLLYNNENDVQWVGNEIWEYKCLFQLDEIVLHGTFQLLTCNGIDTYAELYVNNHFVGTCNNAFTQYTFDVKPYLQNENELRIKFFPVENDKLNPYLVKNKYDLPGGIRNLTRKPQLQYGWDFAPKLLTCGISDDIRLISFSDFAVKDIAVVTNKISASKAYCTCNISFYNSTRNKLLIQFLNKKYEIEINENEHEISFEFEIENPELWNCNGIGKPYLYKEIIQINDWTSAITFGIRLIDLVQAEEPANTESFYFSVNGTKVFAKGANYVPQHILYSNITHTDIDQILQSCIEANFNTIRVWGGGIYLPDYFYEKCDELGLLVWHDFMFACAMYPYDDRFLERVEMEAEQQVKRLRKFACIALWCGNNEIDEAWHNWGWQIKYFPWQKTDIYNGYKKLFENLLPTIVQKNHPTCAYYASSPKYSRFDKRNTTHGDAHNWGVWHDEEVFEIFWNQVPRFMSEYGFQSYPSEKTRQDFSDIKPLDINDPAFNNHQKHTSGNALITRYLQHYYPKPKDKNSIFYLSQLIQAEGISEGIKAHISHLPYCMGTLYWQLNDCWPAVSWSSIDFYGYWKALHYYARKYYAPTIATAEFKDETLIIRAIHTGIQPKKLNIKIDLYSFENKIKTIFETSVQVEYMHSYLLTSFPISAFDSNTTFLHVEIMENGKHLFEDVILFEHKKFIQFPIPNITCNVKNNSIELYAENLAIGVFLHDSTANIFEDNFFFILPKTTKCITAKNEISNTDNLSITSYTDYVQQGVTGQSLYSQPVSIVKKIILSLPKWWRKIVSY